MKSSKDIFNPKFWEREDLRYDDLPTFQEVLGAVADPVALARRVLALATGGDPIASIANPLETSCKVAGAVRAALSWEPNFDSTKTIMVPYALYRADVYSSEIKCQVMPGWLNLGDVVKVKEAILQYICTEVQGSDASHTLPEADEHGGSVIKARAVEMFPIKDVLAARVWLAGDACSPRFVEDFLAKVIYEQFPESLGLGFEFDDETELYKSFDDCENAVIKSDETRAVFGHLEPEGCGRSLTLCEETAAKLNNSARVDFLWRLNDLNNRLAVDVGQLAEGGEMPMSKKETIEKVEQRYKRVVAQMDDLYVDLFGFIAETAANDPRRAKGMLISFRDGILAKELVQTLWMCDEDGWEDFHEVTLIECKRRLSSCADEYLKGIAEAREEARLLLEKLESDGRIEEFKQAAKDKDLYESLLVEYGAR